MRWKWIREVSGGISSKGYTKFWEPLVWGSVYIRVIRATRERKGGKSPEDSGVSRCIKARSRKPQSL